MLFRQFVCFCFDEISVLSLVCKLEKGYHRECVFVRPYPKAESQEFENSEDGNLWLECWNAYC